MDTYTLTKTKPTNHQRPEQRYVHAEFEVIIVYCLETRSPRTDFVVFVISPMPASSCLLVFLGSCFFALLMSLRFRRSVFKSLSLEFQNST